MAQRTYDTILSRKSQKATPLIAKGTHRVRVPSTLSDLVEGHDVKIVDAELVSEPPLILDQILYGNFPSNDWISS